MRIIHANARGTGSALSIERHPATENAEGYMTFAIAPQKTIAKIPEFDWDNALTTKLRVVELANVLEVFRGYCESICDGKGIFHYSAVKATTIRFTHNIEPVNSYSLELAVKKLPDGDLKTVRISLSPTEALALECAISHSLHLLVFGVPSIFND